MCRHVCVCVFMSVTSTATVHRMSCVADSGKYALTCGDIPISAQLVTTAITLMVSKASCTDTQEQNQSQTPAMEHISLDSTLFQMENL